jgi:site-specific DNA-methyltransferase (adenine-specific)
LRFAVHIYENMTKQTYKLINGDCIEEMKKMDANSIDSIVTDPPYEIGFMGKGWDNTGIAYNKDVWKEALRVLKPGGHMLAFSSTRTYHRMVCAIEDSGFEIRDQLAWIYGSGFPKSQNVGKMIDKKAGATRKVVAPSPNRRSSHAKGNGIVKKQTSPNSETYCITEPSTDDAKKYDGWGTALKPAQEPIVLARKPLSEKTVAANVIKHTTGAINIDGCRVTTETDEDLSRKPTPAKGWKNSSKLNGSMNDDWKKGRWPANIIHDGSAEVLELFPDTGKGTGKTVHQNRKRKGFMISGSKDNKQTANSPDNYGDGGSAARFFYCAKANKQDRNNGDAKNNHATVKPTMLMQYLVRMITPIGGTVLDPFNGSGSTGKAAMLLGKYNYIGIDLSSEYIEISKARIEDAIKNAGKDTKEDTTPDTTEEETNFFIE